MENCIFCKIAKHEISAKIAYENEHVIAFHDIKPAAKVHILIIPKKHSSYLQDMSHDQLNVMQHIFAAAQEIAKSTGIAASGYRVLINNGKDAGQEVFHVHAHVLGGEKLGPLNK